MKNLNLKIKVFIILIVLEMSSLSGCVSSSLEKTVYIDHKTNRTLILYHDGRFEEQEDIGTLSGTYVIEGDGIKLHYEMWGLVANIKKDGNNLTYSNPEFREVIVWERE